MRNKDHRSFVLGVELAGEADLVVDLDLVLRSNLLVQANSGGGKSWTLRRMMEQLHATVQQIVVDPEGEFATLRQEHDFVLVGRGGDAPADLRSAPLLAERLLETGASAVIDLFEMRKSERPAWLAAFVGALVDSRKDLWHDLLVYVDEAHDFAPEAGHGRGRDGGEQLSRGALTDLASKGRKRGFGVVAATQRLGKLSKDFAAELKNVLVGQTWIDVDRDRAAEALGVARSGRADFDAYVKTLSPGNFYALGRALCLEATLVRVGDVVTEHPEAGRRQSSPPPPTEKIRHLLPQLADLPREVERRAATEADLRQKIGQLEAELRQRRAEVRTVEVPVAPPGSVKHLEQVRVDLGEVRRLGQSVAAAAEAATVAVASLHEMLLSAPSKIVEKLARSSAHGRTKEIVKRSEGALIEMGDRSAPVERSRQPATRATRPVDALGRGELAILTAVAQHGNEGVTREQLTVLTGYRKSSRDTYLQRLGAWGLVEQRQTPFGASQLVATPSGVHALGEGFEPLPTGPRLLDHWLTELPRGERSVLQYVASVYPRGTTRESITEHTGYRKSSRDTYLHRLGARKLVELQGGEVRASALLF